MPGSTLSIQLAEGQDTTGLPVILRSASRVAITVNDPQNALSKSYFFPAVVVENGYFFRADYDPTRKAYTCLVAKDIQAHVFFDTLLVVQDQSGQSLPIDARALPFTTDAEEVSLSISVLPSVVNAASYLPGIASGTLAVLFGSGITNTPGLSVASGFPLPTKLSGTSVTVNGVPAPLLAVAAQDGQAQINFQVPHFLPDFTGTPGFKIIVNNSGREQTFYVKESNQLGVRAIAHASGDLIDANSPAAPGEQIIIYWNAITGYDFQYSPGTFALPDGVPSPSSAPCVQYAKPQVKIGAFAADLHSCSAVLGLVGIGQLVVTVPVGLPPGTHDVAVTLQSIQETLFSCPSEPRHPHSDCCSLLRHFTGERESAGSLCTS